MRLLVAGATGAVGRPLVRQLVERGHEVVATTRSPQKLDALRKAGARPIVLDGLDRDAVARAVADARPEAIIHQMTALSATPDFKHFDRWFAVTNELRTRGTDNLLAAARATRVRLFIAQGYTGWNNSRGQGKLSTEDDPPDPHPPSAQARTMEALRYLERVVLDAPLTGVVLRYGNLYGPHASDAMLAMVRKRMVPIVGNGSGVWSWLHVDDAAAAAVAALERGSRGVYNVVDDEPAPACQWLPWLAQAVGAKPPFHLPAWIARFFIGDAGVRFMTEGRGASNAKAKRELRLQLTWPTWRDGFRAGLAEAARADFEHRAAA
jgi:nucleoside-diphosphate-sugar epimerase